MSAIRFSSINFIQFIIQNCPKNWKGDLFKKNDYGQTPMHAAAARGDIQIMDYILQNCPTKEKYALFQRDGFGKTPFNYAVRHSKNVIYYFIRRTPDHLLPLSFKITGILSEAARYSDIEGITTLLVACPNADYHALFKEGLLHAAAKSGFTGNIVEVLKWCPKENYSRLFSPLNGETPLHSAAACSTPDGCLAIIKASAEMKDSLYGNEKSLWDACAKGKLENLPVILNFAPEQYIRNFYIQSAYAFAFSKDASEKAYSHAIAALCKSCPDDLKGSFYLTRVPGQRGTPLFAAAERGNIEAMQVILNTCPDEYYEDQFKNIIGSTCLLEVPSIKQEVMNLLLEACPEELHAMLIAHIYRGYVFSFPVKEWNYKIKNLEKLLNNYPVIQLKLSYRFGVALLLAEENDIEIAGEYLHCYQLKFPTEITTYVWENKDIFSKHLEELSDDELRCWLPAWTVFLPLLKPSFIQQLSPQIAPNLYRKLAIGNETYAIEPYLNCIIQQRIAMIDWNDLAGSHYHLQSAKFHLNKITLSEWAALTLSNYFRPLVYDCLKLLSENQIAIVFPNIPSTEEHLYTFIRELGSFTKQRYYIPYATDDQKLEILQQISLLPASVLNWKNDFARLCQLMEDLHACDRNQETNKLYLSVHTEIHAITNLLDGFRCKHALEGEETLKPMWNTKPYENTFLHNEATPLLMEKLNVSLQNLVSTLTIIEEELQTLIAPLRKLRKKFEERVPNKFLDPITCEIMENPIRFPDTKSVIDASTLTFMTRNEKGEIQNPFNRQFYKESALKPAVKLKKKLDHYKSSKAL
jgi:hypothetical protein